MADVLALVSLAIVFGMLALVLWNVLAWPAIAHGRRPAHGVVSVLVPARNEADTIAACLESISLQGRAVREILVYDDHSSDATAAAVVRYAATDPRVRLLQGGELPSGWCGKPHACMRLAEAADSDWLLFLDADARLAPHAIERLLQDAHARDLTFLSAWPGLTLRGTWEQILMPLLNLVVFSLYPAPLALVRPDASLGLAHGACILARRETYVALGGHSLVRGQLFEDGRLAQLWRAHGARGLCLDGQSIVSVRMYRSASGIWRGFQKNFYPAFRRDASFWGFLALHSVAFVVPAALLIAAPSSAAAAAVAGGVLMRVLLAARFGHPFWPAPLHPLAVCVLIALGVSSRWRYRAASGVEWKGRRYGPRGEVA